ncbi:LamG-like jellyroll fold domain-containing protein [Lewinella sp. 4G2]|uniref:VPS10 domain-containing protein n=1 Tax=Lewinella sp. 4G2 TaxID=1803372 RepID=UPI0007B46DDF|nr:LamG-like jellyroll fold domain-containing protein [Lewinella sp. 4G2]OAV45260.1 hypothetical protein A3850_012485 [Lewinella sp. 4G2]
MTYATNLLASGRPARTLFSLLLVVAASLVASAQTGLPPWHFTDLTTTPAPSADMPDYAKPLYEATVNVDAVMELHAAHYGQRDVHEWHEDLERNPYAKYYLQWMEGAKPFIDDNGIVRRYTTEELIAYRQKQLVRNAAKESANTQLKSNGNWTLAGPTMTIWRAEHRPDEQVAPWQSNIYAMAVSPLDQSKLIAGCETGEVFLSTDKGLNWEAVNTFNFANALNVFAFNPLNDDEVLVGTKTDIMRSTDFGTTWTVQRTTAGLSCNTIHFADDASFVVAGSGQGILRSTDNGVTWAQTHPGEVMDLAIKPDDNDVVYALIREGSPRVTNFYKSEDGGLTFTLSMSGWGTYLDHSGGRMDVTPADANVIYAGILTDPVSKTPFVMKSTDAGATWTEIAEGRTPELNLTNGQGYYDLDIMVSDNDADEVIFATTTALKSVDGGVNWTYVGGYNGPFDIHPDIQEMISIGDDTWITTDGGINYSTDFFTDVANWEPRIDGLSGVHFWGFDQGWNEDYMIGGRYHNGNTALHENYPPQLSLRMGGAESATGHAWHGKERYAIFDDIANTIIPDDHTQEAEGTFTFTKDNPNDPRYGAYYSNLLVDREDYNVHYIGEDNFIYRSEDGGITWESLNDFGQTVWAFDISRADPDYFYLVANNSLWRSTDRGVSWTGMTTPPGIPSNRIRGMRIAASGTDADELWVMDEHAQGSFGNNNRDRVWYSNDGGSSWTSWHTPTLEGRRYQAFTHHVGSNGGVYIGSDRGGAAGTFPAKVYYRDKDMTDWVDCSANLPASARPQKMLPFYRDNKIRYASDMGIWEMPLVQQDWAPIAQPFVEGKEVQCTSDPVNFDSYSVALAEATYEWDLGGGTVAEGALNEREVSALFPTPGKYTVTLTVTQGGQSDSKSIEVNVGDACQPDELPGNSAYVSAARNDHIATVRALEVDETNNFTVSMWIKPDGVQGYFKTIMAGGDSGFKLNYHFSNETLGFHYPGASHWQFNSRLAIVPDEWNHVAITVDDTKFTLYVNGVPSVRNWTVPEIDFSGSYTFGYDRSFGSRNFKGEFDEIVMLSRTMSKDEIRELMHLTRIPEDDPDYLAYYQFNHDDGLILNRAGGVHARLNGAAARMTSDCPVGPGVSQRQDVLAAGAQAFGETGLTLDFAAGTVPDGELCVTRIDLQPDVLPVSENLAESYWVVHNYGANETFTELAGMTFEGVPVTDEMSAKPEAIELFKRSSEAHGATWDDAVATATSATAGDAGTVVFGAGNGQTSFSQFIIGTSQLLPVELMRFDATVEGRKAVRLYWASSSEEGFDRYEIERSDNGNTFEYLGAVAGAGEVGQAARYQFLDESPNRGRQYYRLKMVDADGTFEYSDVRSVLLNGFAGPVTVYPNPATSGETLNVLLRESGNYEFEIFNATGERVGEHRISSDAQIPLPQLPAGAYTWRIRGEGLITQGRVIIE